jgi:hypothetical protein
MDTGLAADPVLVDRRTGLPLTLPPYHVIAGPAASERVRRRYASKAASEAGLSSAATHATHATPAATPAGRGKKAKKGGRAS